MFKLSFYQTYGICQHSNSHKHLKYPCYLIRKFMEQFLSSDCISMKTKKSDNTIFASIKQNTLNTKLSQRGNHINVFNQRLTSLQCFFIKGGSDSTYHISSQQNIHTFFTFFLISILVRILIVKLFEIFKRRISKSVTDVLKNKLFETQ